MVTRLEEAYASCERTARTHYENFPVASLLLPRPLRPHVAAVYAFARSADDFADEGSLAPAERHALLDGWLDRLRRIDRSGSVDRPRPGEPVNAPEIFRALGATMREKRLPPALFEDLLSAFRQDVSVRRYESWSDVLDYCRRSANPVGRLVLRIAGHDDPRLDAWSDAICSALQLANFWQDFRIDFERGRLYLPRSEALAHGADERDLAQPSTPQPWRRAVRAAVERTEGLFATGRPLCDALAGRLRWELRATWLGGTRILRAIERADFDVMGRRPTISARDLPWLAWHAATWVPR